MCNQNGTFCSSQLARSWWGFLQNTCRGGHKMSSNVCFNAGMKNIFLKNDNEMNIFYGTRVVKVIYCFIVKPQLHVFNYYRMIDVVV